MTVPDLPESRMYTSLLTGITGSSLALCLLSWLSFMRCLYECSMSDNCSWSVSFGFSVDGSTGRSVRNRRLINSSAGEYPLWIGVLRYDISSLYGSVDFLSRFLQFVQHARPLRFLVDSGANWLCL